MSKPVQYDMRPWMITLSRILELEGNLDETVGVLPVTRQMMEDVTKALVDELTGQDVEIPISEILAEKYPYTVSSLPDEEENGYVNRLIDDVYDTLSTLLRPRRGSWFVEFRHDFAIFTYSEYRNGKPKTLKECKRWMASLTDPNSDSYDHRAASALRLIEEYEANYTR